MKPFVVFSAPDKMKWNARPKGRKRYRVDMWARLTTGELDQVSVTPDKPCTISDLLPLVDSALAELLENKELADYGFSAYVWG